MGQDVEGMGIGERAICLSLFVCLAVAVFTTVNNKYFLSSIVFVFLFPNYLYNVAGCSDLPDQYSVHPSQERIRGGIYPGASHVHHSFDCQCHCMIDLLLNIHYVTHSTLVLSIDNDFQM